MSAPPHDRPGDLPHLPLDELIDLVGRRTPTPGGGAVAAISLSMAASLVQMVIAYSDAEAGGEALGETRLVRLRAAGGEALALARRDAEAYAAYRAAHRAGTPEARRAALEAAIDVPLAVCALAAEVAEAATRLAAEGNPRLHADAVIASQLAAAAAEGAAALVLSNLAGRVDARRERLDRALSTCRSAAAATRAGQPSGGPGDR
ncbi:cyclodeaminase/cyclohydrolase family protein [Nocardioides humi]|uniref:Cyclodeaminase/cyclohydrolase domain-containing protein n=1 Tax=Nocardioides humi TaxID=449461 RepID=A0ABN1ZZS5_9ACTN|nr:cyclodeaminase/cyclohydrolase family protein [Nocardioides humi]